QVEAMAAESSDWTTFFHKLLRWGNRNSAAWALLLCMIQTLVSPAVDFYEKRGLSVLHGDGNGRKTKEVVKNGTKQVRKLERKSPEAPSLAVVERKTRAYSSRSRDSTVVGWLPAGQVVALGERKRKWVKIAWLDARTGRQLEG